MCCKKLILMYWTLGPLKFVHGDYKQCTSCGHLGCICPAVQGVPSLCAELQDPSEVPLPEHSGWASRERTTLCWFWLAGDSVRALGGAHSEWTREVSGYGAVVVEDGGHRSSCNHNFTPVIQIMGMVHVYNAHLQTFAKHVAYVAQICV